MSTILNFLFCLYFILFPLGNLLRLGVGGNIYISVQDIVLVVILIVFFSDLRNIKKLLFTNKFLTFQILFLLVGIISLLMNILIFKDIKIFTSILYALRYLSLLLLIPAIQKLGNTSYIQKLMIVSGLVFLVLGIGQYLLLYDLRPFTYLGWDNHLYRLFSTFIDPNFSGVFYCVYFFILLSKIYDVSFKKSYIYILISFFTVVAIYLTYSRTAFLSFIAGSIIFFVLIKRTKFIFLFLLLAISFGLLFKDSLIEGSNPFRVVSSSNRILSLNQTIKIYEHNPLLGVGFNAFRYAQVRYSTRDIVGANKSNADAGTDNSFLFVLVTTGFVGFIFYILSFLYLVKDLLGKSFYKKIVILPIVAIIIVSSLFINVLFYPLIMVWFLTLIGLSNRSTKDDMKLL